MKKLITIIGLFFSTISMASASSADDIVGIWLSASGEGKIQIYKEGDLYFGKLYWMKEPNGPRGNPKLDSNNPDPALRNRPLLGLVILKNFRYNDGEWNGGHIYDPKNGKEYKSYIRLKDAQTLSLRGYIGISLLGRTELWKRAG
ncbi:MAG: DUF2147 domain-containing protein [Bacteroidetes bacterium]|nr:DUF2147 domain-containing protein [Bacteroidota bacterium]